jgi:two-component sensor histidine kinase
VTNAVRHGHLAPDEHVEVKVDVTDGNARVEVRQPTRAAAAMRTLIQAHESDEGGFGLQLVDELTESWGIEPGPPGVVWFEIKSEAAG